MKAVFFHLLLFVMLLSDLLSLHCYLLLLLLLYLLFWGVGGCPLTAPSRTVTVAEMYRVLLGCFVVFTGGVGV